MVLNATRTFYHSFSILIIVLYSIILLYALIFAIICTEKCILPHSTQLKVPVASCMLFGGCVFLQYLFTVSEDSDEVMFGLSQKSSRTQDADKHSIGVTVLKVTHACIHTHAHTNCCTSFSLHHYYYGTIPP